MGNVRSTADEAEENGGGRASVGEASDGAPQEATASAVAASFGNMTIASVQKAPRDTIIDTTKEFHIAPMMGVTFREFRYFVRLLSKRAVLWTEMVVDDTILHSDNLDYHLGYDTDVEPPIICQIGGNQAGKAAAVTREVTQNYGYTEINLNAGCPSHRVASKRAFGAALLQDLSVAIAMLQSMNEGVRESGANVSIKLRIGVDDDDDWEWTRQTVAHLSKVCKRFYVHARKVLTKGLDPAQNRRIPPLHYPRVYALCREFPDCEFWINGGIMSIDQARDVCFGIVHSAVGDDNSTSTAPEDVYSGLIPPGHGALPCPTCCQSNGSCVTPPIQATAPPNLRGCLIGRAVMDDPINLLATLDTDFYGASDNPAHSRRQVLCEYAEYLTRLYPRRCGDCFETHAQITTRPPGVDPVANYHCPLCKQGIDERPASHLGQPLPQLIHRHIIGRAFKPVQGAFCGLAGIAKPWRRFLQQAMNDKEHVNCGPGYLLLWAVRQLEQGQCTAQPVTAALDELFPSKINNRR